MNRRNHITWTYGLSLWIWYYIFSYNFSESFFLAFFCAAIVWLPDIDLKVIEKIKHWNKKTFYLTKPISYLFSQIFKHRGITHTIYIPLIAFTFAEIYPFSQTITIFLRIFYIAILLHILEDSFTKNGIEPLYPIPIKFRIWNFSTTSTIHSILFDIIALTSLISYFILLG